MNPPTVPTLPNSALFSWVKVEEIRASRIDLRGEPDGPKFTELVASVKEKGVLQAILVRPLPGHAPGRHQYEIVAGRRRLAAARVAGIVSVPALVRELEDAEALELQVIENLQRADVHPLEEAEGYRLLHEKHKYDIVQLAAKVGKSRGYIYGRLKLGALKGKARDLFLSGELDASVALVVARIPNEALQSKAARTIAEQEMNYRDALSMVQREFMLALSSAPFDVKDAGLVKVAGACATCPKRTGNQSELFSDVKGADVCTDPVCFRAKSDAAWVRRKAEENRRCVDGAPAAKLLNAARAYNGEVVDLKDSLWQIAPGANSDKSIGAAVRKILEPDQVTLARGEDGVVHELVPRKVALELAKKSGAVKKNQDRLAGGGDYQAKQNREAKKAKVRARAMVAAVLAKAKNADHDQVWPVIVSFVFDRAHHETAVEVCRARGIELGKVKRSGYTHREAPGDAIRKFVAAHEPAKERAALLRELVFQVMVTAGAPATWSPEPRGALVAAAKALGIDLAAVGRRAVELEAKRATSKKKAKATKGGKRGRTRSAGA